MMNDGGMMMAPMMIVMMVFGVLVVTALILGIVWLVRALTHDGRSDRGGALETLEMRYARGEIDRDDYLQRRDNLERPT